MRADRLVAILLLLQRREQLTAAQVAAELEVSTRTARRDLESLAMAGLPVYSTPGRSGGWRLLGGGRTDLSGLSAPEARALFLLAGTSTSVTPELKAALRKLVRALPESMRTEMEAVGRSVVVDPSEWGRRQRAEAPPRLDDLQAAITSGQQVRLAYRNRAGEESTRVVHPLGLAQKARVWYLVADTDEGRRTFRVSRVRGLERTGDRAERPAGFDLEASWREVVDRVDQLRSPEEIVALVDPPYVETLQWIFGGQAELGPIAADGRTRVRLGGPSSLLLAARVAGFGRHVEVVAPPEARSWLATLGAELGQLYSPRGRPVDP